MPRDRLVGRPGTGVPQDVVEGTGGEAWAWIGGPTANGGCEALDGGDTAGADFDLLGAADRDVVDRLDAPEEIGRELEHTFDPPADASAIKRALIFRSYSYAVEARDASSITFTKSYEANAALEALLGTKRVVARHITRFTEGGAETAVRGRVDVLGGIEFSIDLAYAEGRCVGALRVQLAGCRRASARWRARSSPS